MPLRQRLEIEQVANALHVTVRWLQEWLRAHPVDAAGEPYCTPVGRKRIFHPSDITRIEKALREDIKRRYTSGRCAPAKRRILKSEAPSQESMWRRAAELLNDPSLIEAGKNWRTKHRDP
ncbi:hypothetical protein [Bradyrhizobium centrolobii]|nr:hypothetical protein [Bradyrhizobium centrolobii]